MENVKERGSIMANLTRNAIKAALIKLLDEMIARSAGGE